MKGMGIAAMALGIDGLGFSPRDALASESEQPRQMGQCKLPPLPYAYDRLEPYIDTETVTIHHDKHHAGYVKGLNIAMAELEKARTSGDFQLIKHWSRELAFNGSGHVLHSLYWANMSPGGGNPKGEIMAAINSSFGGFDQFKKQFVSATKAVEASGWGILAYEPYMGNLVILQAEKHQDLAIWGVYPLLVCDVWEHAYYLKYQNRRGDYVDNFFKIIHWAEVGKRYSKVKGLVGYR
jgi:Fe-Mn family superoxide dismutase